MADTTDAVAAHLADIQDLKDEVARPCPSRKLTASEQADAIGRTQQLIRDHRLAIDNMRRAGRREASGDVVLCRSLL